MSGLPPVIDCLLFSFQMIDVIVEANQKSFCFIAVCCCDLFFFKAYFLGALLLLEPLFFLLKELFGRLLCLFNVFLLLFNSLLLLIFSVLFGFLSFFEGSFRCFELLGGSFHVGIGVARITAIGLLPVGVVMLRIVWICLFGFGSARGC